MKHLPCQSPQCVALGAMLPASQAYPNGEPAFTGQFVRENTCARCGKTTTFTAADFARVRDLKLPDFERLAARYGVKALANMPTKDLEGAGLPREHARQMFEAGFHSLADPELPPRAVEPRDSDPGPGPS